MLPKPKLKYIIRYLIIYLSFGFRGFRVGIWGWWLTQNTWKNLCVTKVFHTLAGFRKSFFQKKCVRCGRMDSKNANEHRADMTPTYPNTIQAMYPFRKFCKTCVGYGRMSLKVANEHRADMTPTRFLLKMLQSWLWGVSWIHLAAEAWKCLKSVF